MRDDFGICLRFEGITELLQARALLFVILDDAVVHHGDLAAGDMRMSIEFGDPAVRRPARMADACRARKMFLISTALHFRDAAHRAHSANLAVAEYGHARRIIAAIFQTAQSFHQYGYNVAFRHRPYDAAHIISFLSAGVSIQELLFA